MRKLLPFFSKLKVTKPAYSAAIGVPALSVRCFSNASSKLCTYAGRKPVDLPSSVELQYLDHPLDDKLKTLKNTRTLVVKGPLGEVKMSLFPFIDLSIEPNLDPSTSQICAKYLKVNVPNDPTKKQHKEMWTTTRTLIKNATEGVTDGHYSILKINGVGYKAAFANDAKTKLDLRLGYSHPILIDCPKNLKCYIPNPNTIVVSGVDKQQVKLFAYEIRRWRKPEPYKLKGIFVDGEYIRKKEVKKK